MYFKRMNSMTFALATRLHKSPFNTEQIQFFQGSKESNDNVDFPKIITIQYSTIQIQIQDED